MPKKKTKLTEKATRIPDTRQVHWEAIIPQYLQEIEQLNKEQARSHRFAMLVQQLLGVEPNFIENYSAGIEESLKVRQKDRILRGEPDNLFGNIIIEFEGNIPKNRSQAEEQLRRYLAILWSQEAPDARRPYLCIATDGVRFVTYSPKLASTLIKDVTQDDVTLHVLEEADWAKFKPHEVFYWLDRYFLRKEILHPTSDTIVHDFGVRSHAFKTTTNALLSLWQEVEDQSAFKVIYNSWKKYLHIVYGSEVAGDELFVRHTYLATLAKLMSWMRITESTYLPDEAEIIEMLEGRSFKAQGIENFIEEDFFSWLARQGAVKVGVAVVRWLFSLLQNYNLRELSEDVLKSLYQELVDPETRHDLGEFYTPDWLAHRMVRKLLDANPHGSMLDPACGSGTFLYLAIREKRERLGDSSNTLRHILDSVYGADIHPLAVIISKTNYILALGDLLKKRKGTIMIPIYLADTIRLPERELKPTLWMQLPSYRVEIDGREILLPEPLLENLALYDQAIELAKEFARQNKGKPVPLELFRNFCRAQHFSESDNDALVRALYTIMEVLKHFIDKGRDTIWAFILKNIYKPLFFKCKFDFVVGNPPWIVFRYMEPTYQTYLKRQIVQEYRLLRPRVEQLPNLEIATLFLVRAADIYLKTDGTIAFVLPRSLFSSDQHDGLRRRIFRLAEEPMRNLFWREIWDCEHVEPLFNVPACVVIADKREAAAVEYPLPGETLNGKFDIKNSSLAEFERRVRVNKIEFSLRIHGGRSFWTTEKDAFARKASHYKSAFSRGVNAILPHSFWLVEVKPSLLGFNPNLPLIQTAEWAERKAKAAYKNLSLKGAVESRFLYVTLLSTDLLPFGQMDFRLVVLPIEPRGAKFKLIDSIEARKRGFLHLANWLENAEHEWTERRGPKAGRMSIYEYLNLFGGITRQNPQARYRVIYNKSGTFLTAALVKNEFFKFDIGGQIIFANGFVADQTLYYYQTNDSHEAFFLTALLNAPVIDKMIKPMQSRGLWGPRDIHKKALELPIPQFDMADPDHQQLAEFGRECSTKVKRWLEGGGTGKIKSIGRLRGMVREMLKDELKEIDALVNKILG
jgi:hypothetical protein